MEAEVPVCKHWRRTGTCFFGEKCRFLHPVDIVPLETQSPKPIDASGKPNDDTRKLNRGENKRNRIRNASKCGFFRRFLIDIFGLELLRSGSGVVDIAGGNGELSFELLNLSQIPCTVIDPRPFSITRWENRLKSGYYYLNEAFNLYHTRPRQEAESTNPLTPNHFPIMFKDYLWDDRLDPDQKHVIFAQEVELARALRWTEKGLVESFVDTEAEEILSEVRTQNDSSSPLPWVELDKVTRTLEEASVIVGMHPDQAAGAIVDFALEKNMPFALVPCCTYAKEFPKRKLKSGEPVRSYEQLVRFLVEKDESNIKTLELPFEGKNICIYSTKKT